MPSIRPAETLAGSPRPGVPAPLRARSRGLSSSNQVIYPAPSFLIEKKFDEGSDKKTAGSG